jgi:hypothetical protein
VAEVRGIVCDESEGRKLPRQPRGTHWEAKPVTPRVVGKLEQFPQPCDSQEQGKGWP